MANIEVTVRSHVIGPGSPTHCAVVITNCDAMYSDTKRQRVNGPISAFFMNVPPGRYYIVVVPEGGNAHQGQFSVIDAETEVVTITFDISLMDPVGKITAIVLVGDQYAPGKTVMLKGQEDGYAACCMTNYEGMAEFQSVPETQAYDVIAYHRSAGQRQICDLKTFGDCAKQFNFDACPVCGG